MNDIIKPLPLLKAGDWVEIIAPASRLSPQQLFNIKTHFESWGLNCRLDDAIFGSDLLCANSDTYRLQSLVNALTRPETKAIICARGGYGSMRLIPALSQLPPPLSPKLLIGMSDITALHLYVGQHWQWPTIHGSVSFHHLSDSSIAAMKSLLFEDVKPTYHGEPLNSHATINRTLFVPIVGGNLSLIQTSIGTSWQLKGQDKIIFIEEIGERGYRIDRMLEHLQQAHLFQGASAIIFGDLMGGDEPNGTSLLQPVVRRFAESCDIPVLQLSNIGHGSINMPLILGLPTTLILGQQIQMIGGRT